MKEKKIFEGVGTAIITPMKEDGSINEAVFKDLIEWQVNEGADAVVVAGTTGEASTLSDEEHLRLVECAVGAVQGRNTGYSRSREQRYSACHFHGKRM